MKTTDAINRLCDEDAEYQLMTEILAEHEDAHLVDDMDVLYPVPIEGQKGGSEAHQVIIDCEFDSLKMLARLWKISPDNDRTRERTKNLVFKEIVDSFWVGNGKPEEYLRLLKTYPGSSFIKSKLNRGAWLKNRIYRSNVNIEGYAYWNAAIFVYMATRKYIMLPEDISLVLRSVAFNETVIPQSMFAPIVGAIGENGATELSLAEEEDAWSDLIYQLRNAITKHRKKTGRRYSRRPLDDRNADPQAREIIKTVRGIVDSCKKSAKTGPRRS